MCTHPLPPLYLWSVSGTHVFFFTSHKHQARQHEADTNGFKQTVATVFMPLAAALLLFK